MRKKYSNLDEIENYFKTMHDTQALSSTEISNLLNAYLKFIFDINGLNREDFNISIHFAKNVSQVPSEDVQSKKDKFIAQQMGEKLKTYSHKEVIKRNKDDSLNALMQYVESSDIQFKIYVHERLAHIKSQVDFNSLVDLLVDFGHETQHIIQHLIANGTAKNVNNNIARANNLLYSALKNGNDQQKKLVKKIYEKYSDFLGHLSTDEYYADINSYKYLHCLFESLSNKTENLSMQNFYELFDTEVSMLEAETQEFLEKICKEFDKFKNTLPENPFIKKEDLIIP